jgi:hypothetical protein
MVKLIIASLRAHAGKTSIIAGLANVLDKPFGYMKPFGDRSLYRKKRLWDQDAALMTHLFGLTDAPEEMSIGFDHSKLQYMYDEDSRREKLHEVMHRIGTGKEILFIEGGHDITYGASVCLDAITLAKQLGGNLVIVISGDTNAILDEIAFINTYVKLAEVHFGGVIINKLHDLEDFNATALEAIKEMGVEVLGALPYQPELTFFSLDDLAERLFAKVIAGAAGLNRLVQNILVGAMSVDAMLRHPGFQAESKLIITSGDRSDMILAALESDTAGIVLTNNILPPPNITALASERNIPLLLVLPDTYQIAKQIDDLEPLLTPTNTEKLSLLAQLIKTGVQIERLT